MVSVGMQEDKINNSIMNITDKPIGHYLLKLNLIFILSGMLLFVALYLYSLISKNYYYYFFLIPMGIVYIVLMNILFVTAWSIYKKGFFKNITSDKLNKNLIYLSVGSNILLAIAFLMCQ